MKDPRNMTASEINRELDSLDKKDSRLNDELIAAGYGHVTPSEILKQSHPLAVRLRALFDRRFVLKSEIRSRTGSDYRRMPTRRSNPRQSKTVNVTRRAVSRRTRRNPYRHTGRTYETTLNTVRVKFFQGYVEDVRYTRAEDGKPYSHVVETDAAELYLCEHATYGRCLLIVDPSGKTPLWG